MRNRSKSLPIPLVTALVTVLLVVISAGAGSGVLQARAHDSEGRGVGHRECVEVGSAEGFAVKECLVYDRSGELTANLPPWPSAMLQVLGSELQWRELFIVGFDYPQQVEGTYARLTSLEGKAFEELISHPFVLEVEGEQGSARLALELENHAVSGVVAEVLDDGSGSIDLVYRDGSKRRFLFDDGRLVYDSAAGESPRLSESEKSSSFYMGCYIDTPAWDVYRADLCFALGSSPSLVSFKVFLPYKPSSVVWSAPSSSCSSIYCSAPISPGQTVYGYAYWVINGTPTGPVGATARYLYEPGF